MRNPPHKLLTLSSARIRALSRPFLYRTKFLQPVTRLLLILALFCVAVPAAQSVTPASNGKTHNIQASSQGAEKNAAKACKAERAKDSAAFKTKYGKNPNKANAFGECVSMKAKKDKVSEDEAD